MVRKPPLSGLPPPPADPLAVGAGVIESYLKGLPAKPGVYRMISAEGGVLYVGKAQSLKKRVAGYAKPLRQSARIRRMVAQTAAMEFVITNTEAEALLLEANLIKSLRPRYNILLRDDKSFPSILVTGGHPFARIVKHRGARSSEGDYFGPFACAGAVNETLNILQRAFLLRTCSDAVFAGRTRPCLLYQIKRCSAPCVARIGHDEYAELADEARAFLRGESNKIQRQLAVRMQTAGDAMEFEKAALYRDRIRALADIQARQDINVAAIGEVDVIAAHQEGGQTCVQVFFFRAGRNCGNKAYFPGHAEDHGVEQVLEAFIGQFYDGRRPPRRIMVSHRLPAQALLAEALGVRAGQPVIISRPVRGDKRKLTEHALANARETLGRRLGESASQRRLLDGLAEVLSLEAAPGRIEVYDNSHISGAKAVGAMIVAGPEGLLKKAYRKFTIQGDPTPGDDYAMMSEVLTRRFARALKEDPDRSLGRWPDLILVDGGGGHLNAALQVFADLGIDDIAVAAIAKGRDRNAGRERIFLPGVKQPLALDARNPVLYFLQRLRDEAHRFAVGAHRAKRLKGISRSVLDEIPGIGPKRRKALLHHFGSARAVTRAGRADLEAVEGISKEIANKIHDWVNNRG